MMMDLHWCEVLKRMILVLILQPQSCDARVFSGSAIDLNTHTMQRLGCFFNQELMRRAINVPLSNLLCAMTGGYKECFLGFSRAGKEVWSRIIYSFEGNKYSLPGNTVEGVVQNSTTSSVIFGKIVFKIYGLAGLTKDCDLMQWASQLTPIVPENSIFTVLRPAAGQKRALSTAHKAAKAARQAELDELELHELD